MKEAVSGSNDVAKLCRFDDIKAWGARSRRMQMSGKFEKGVQNNDGRDDRSGGKVSAKSWHLGDVQGEERSGGLWFDEGYGA